MTGIVKGRSAHGAAGLPRGGEVTVSSLYAPVGGEPPRERARRRKAVGRDLERRWGGRWRPRQPQAEDQHTQRSRAASRTAVGGEGSRGESQQRSGVAHQPDRRHTWNGTGVQQLHTRTYTVGAARAGGAEEGGGEEGRGHYRWVGRRSSGERCALERWGGKAHPFGMYACRDVPMAVRYFQSGGARGPCPSHTPARMRAIARWVGSPDASPSGALRSYVAGPLPRRPLGPASHPDTPS